MSKRALGKGLGALIKDLDDGKLDQRRDLVKVKIGKIRPNPFQMRERFDKDALNELADSIKAKGIIQPLLVEAAKDDTYIIIAGERRYRAAKIAGLDEVPVLARGFSEADKLEVALIENVQRENLTPVEEARGYKNLIDKLKLNQEQVAKRVGKNRTTIANSIRLLKLPENILESLDSGIITAGHARAILSLPLIQDRQYLFKLITGKNLSVRAAEIEAGKLTANFSAKDKAGHNFKSVPPELENIEQSLIDLFGTKVRIAGDFKKGKIEVSYFSSDDFDRLLKIFGLE